MSCPNLHDGAEMFAHSPAATAAAVAAARRSGLPCWAKLSPTPSGSSTSPRAAVDAGADALVLVNTLRALVVDVERRTSVLGAGAGGLSGRRCTPSLHWVARVPRRAARRRRSSASAACAGAEVVAFVLAGADAVEVGHRVARRPARAVAVLDATATWCARHGVARLRDLKGQLDG